MFTKLKFLRLPKDLQDALHEVYVEIQMTNAIVSVDLHKVAWGGGYLDNRYKEKCGKILERAQKIRTLLREWLKQEGIEVE